MQIVRSVHFAASPASDLMASGCRDKKVRVFTTSLQTMDPLVQFSALRDSVHSVRFFNDDKEILVAYSDTPGLSVLDVRTGATRPTCDDSYTFVDCARKASFIRSSAWQLGTNLNQTIMWASITDCSG
jgi:WD40 repeat protein